MYILKENQRTKQESDERIKQLIGNSNRKPIMRFDGLNRVINDTVRREHYRVARTIDNMPSTQQEAFAILSDVLGGEINKAIRKNS